MWLINEMKKRAVKCEKVLEVYFRKYQAHYASPREVDFEIKFDNYLFFMKLELRYLINEGINIEKINIETLILFAENLLKEKYIKEDKLREMFLGYLKKEMKK